MPETFNPIISHLYSGQGGVSREITKYNNTTISEINVVDNGVTTKYDFGKLSIIPVMGSVLKNTIKQPLDSIKFYGNTMRWCQLCVDPTFATGNKWSGATIANNKATMTGTGGIAQAFNMVRTQGNKFSLVQNHYYLFAYVCTSSYATTHTSFRLYDGTSNWYYPFDAALPVGKTFASKIYKYTGASTDATVYLYANYATGALPVGETMVFENFQIFDLTYIFGEGNEPTTESDFIRRLRKLVYPYSPGELLCIEQASAYLYGLNIWDEEWEVGGYSSATGAKDASTNKIRSKNPIRVLPSTDYYATIGQEDYGYITLFYYDAEYNYIGYYSVMPQGSGSFTTPASACFVAFQLVKSDYNNQYHNDICISLSNASTNGTYEASKGEQQMRLLSANIYDRRLDTTNYALNSSGNIESNSKRLVSDYIDISGASYVSMNYGASYAFYSESKVFISGETKSYSVFRSYAIPSGAKYVRIDNTIDTISGQDIMMVKGQYTSETLPSYTPFGYGYATLNGVGDAVDTVTVNKNNTGSYVKNVGMYTFDGTENWLQGGSQTTAGMYRYYLDKDIGMKVGTAQGGWCNKFDNLGANFDSSTTDGVFFGYNNRNFQFVTATAKTNAELQAIFDSSVTIVFPLSTPVETALTAEQCAEILNGAFTKSKYSTLLIDNDNGQIDQTVDVDMWEQR